MDVQIHRLINDLRLIAFTTPDPSEREKALKIIDRISNKEAWPNQDEITTLRLRYSASQLCHSK